MPQFTKALKLDVDVVNRHQYVDAKQLDDGSRYITVTLLANGVPIVPEDGTTAMFRAVKPDGHSVCYEAQLNEDGTVTVVLSQQTLACKGVVKADVSLVGSDGSTLSTASFFLQVQEAPLGDNIASESELLIFQELAQSAAESAAKSAEDAALADSALEEVKSASAAAVQAAENAETAKDTSVEVAQKLSSTVEAAEAATKAANESAEACDAATESAKEAATNATDAASAANAAKESADVATEKANTAAEAAKEAASAVGDEIDGIVIKDTTNSITYLAKFRLIDGMPTIEYAEI